jgi:hypothetical protein
VAERCIIAHETDSTSSCPFASITPLAAGSFLPHHQFLNQIKNFFCKTFFLHISDNMQYNFPALRNCAVVDLMHLHPARWPSAGNHAALPQRRADG